MIPDLEIGLTYHLLHALIVTVLSHAAVEGIVENGFVVVTHGLGIR
jgi:hypothetical protein